MEGRRIRWFGLLAVMGAMACTGGFATDANQIGSLTPADAASYDTQLDIADSISDKTGGILAPSVSRDVLVSQTGGTAIVAINNVMNTATGSYATLNAPQQATVQLMDNIFGSTISGSSILANAAGVEADLRVLTGSYAAAAANVGGMTGAAIGGGGGVVDTRVASVMNERRGLVDRFGSDSAMAAGIMNKNFANRIWVSPFYTKQNMDRKDNYAGYDYKAWGASLGYDHAFGPVTAGVAFTYSQGDYDEKNVYDDNTIDNYGFSAYVNYYNCSGFFATISGGYNYGDNDMKRWVYNAGTPGWQNSDNHTNTYWVGGNLGYDIKATSNFTLTPSVGLFWSESTGSAFTATGAAGNQSFSKIKAKSLLLPIDLTARYKVDLGCDSSITFKAAGGYAYNFKNDGANGYMTYGFDNALPINVNGVKAGRSSWNVGGGITYERGRFDVGVDYRYDGRKKFDGHRVSATIGVNF